MSTEIARPRSFEFSSPAGRALCRQILAARIPFDPHDYQLEGVCKALDGVDVLAVTPTGSGKTGFLTMYMLLARAFAHHPHLSPVPLSVKFKRDPLMVVVCPTKSLEFDMEPKFNAVGLTTVVINVNTVESARHEGKDLWKIARKVSVILLAPEQLKTRGFEALVHDKSVVTSLHPAVLRIHDAESRISMQWKSKEAGVDLEHIPFDRTDTAEEPTQRKRHTAIIGIARHLTAQAH